MSLYLRRGYADQKGDFMGRCKLKIIISIKKTTLWIIFKAGNYILGHMNVKLEGQVIN